MTVRQTWTTSYELSGQLEIDEVFFERIDNKEDRTPQKDETEKSSTGKSVKIKRGRGSEKQAKVLVMAESKPVDDPQSKHKPNRKVGFIKMKVMGNLKGDRIGEVLEESVNKAATILLSLPFAAVTAWLMASVLKSASVDNQ